MKNKKKIIATIQVSPQTKALSPKQKQVANEINRKVQRNLFPDSELKK